jgi:hypothetical protein
VNAVCWRLSSGRTTCEVIFAQLAILGGEPIEGLSLSIAWGKRDSGLLELAEVLEAKEPRSGKDQFKMLDGIANGSL